MSLWRSNNPYCLVVSEYLLHHIIRGLFEGWTMYIVSSSRNSTLMGMRWIPASVQIMVTSVKSPEPQFQLPLIHEIAGHDDVRATSLSAISKIKRRELLFRAQYWSKTPSDTTWVSTVSAKKKLGDNFSIICWFAHHHPHTRPGAGTRWMAVSAYVRLICLICSWASATARFSCHWCMRSVDVAPSPAVGSQAKRCRCVLRVQMTPARWQMSQTAIAAPCSIYLLTIKFAHLEFRARGTPFLNKLVLAIKQCECQKGWNGRGVGDCYFLQAIESRKKCAKIFDKLMGGW